jgi:hypothetical protein
VHDWGRDNERGFGAELTEEAWSHLSQLGKAENPFPFLDSLMIFSEEYVSILLEHSFPSNCWLPCYCSRRNWLRWVWAEIWERLEGIDGQTQRGEAIDI